MFVNIRVGWKWQKVTNTLAFYESKLFTVVKKFYISNPGCQDYLNTLLVTDAATKNKLGYSSFLIFYSIVYYYARKVSDPSNW